MNFAVIDTIKWEDLGNDNHSSKNICLPMNKGILLNVLNEKPITPETQEIQVRIRAEKGFRPQEDIDLASLRFGSYTEVNFGRGAKAISSQAEGNDLIVTFDGTASGITPDEFAPKLLGRDKRGKLLFGYASLPYIDYKPAILSALHPLYNKGKEELMVEVENFGLSASKETDIVVEQGGKCVAKGKVPALKPYEKTTVRLQAEGAAWSDTAACQVTFLQNGVTRGKNLFEEKKETE